VVSSVNLVSSDLATLAVSSLSNSANLKLSVSEAKTSIDQASEQVSETSSRFAAEAEPRLPLLPSTVNENQRRKVKLKWQSTGVFRTKFEGKYKN
jgi:hypothetical protein